MAHEKGDPKTPGSGRKPGTPNKFTVNVKAAWEEAFDELGGKDALVQWGRRNPDDFFKCLSKLLPKDVTVDVGANIADLIKQARERVTSGRSD